VTPAWAQTDGSSAGAPPPVQFLFLASLVGIFYFLLIRPEQKRRREHKQVLANLKRNDRVALMGGIHGRVMALADKVVTIEIAKGVQVDVDREAIQRVETVQSPEAREKERAKQ
jgi:preprotein translocase subunit YajC